jgi:hypothetical protein
MRCNRYLGSCRPVLPVPTSNMGLALDYGSDDSDQEDQAPAPPPVKPAATTSALGLPPPKNKKRALKIGFDHPLLSAPTFGNTPQDEDEGDERASKRARYVKEEESSQVADKTGKGKSTLLDMLPPPKRAVVPSTSTTTQIPTQAAEEDSEEPATLMPRKLAKHVAGKTIEPAGLDLFGLGKPFCLHHTSKILMPLQRLPHPPYQHPYKTPPRPPLPLRYSPRHPSSKNTSHHHHPRKIRTRGTTKTRKAHGTPTLRKPGQHSSPPQRRRWRTRAPSDAHGRASRMPRACMWMSRVEWRRRGGRRRS